MPGVRVLLLCGGRSSRFGADKLVVPVKRGDGVLPMAAAAAIAAIKGAGDALAVIPPGSSRLGDVLEGAGCDIVESTATARGLGASLAAGVLASGDADGWIVALGDMPFIAPSTFTAVLSAVRSGALIAVPIHETTKARGHPIGFTRALRDELLVLDGDEGGRSIVQRHQREVKWIPVQDDGITVDIDTPGDLAATSA